MLVCHVWRMHGLARCVVDSTSWQARRRWYTGSCVQLRLLNCQSIIMMGEQDTWHVLRTLVTLSKEVEDAPRSSARKQRVANQGACILATAIYAWWCWPAQGLAERVAAIGQDLDMRRGRSMCASELLTSRPLFSLVQYAKFACSHGPRSFPFPIALRRTI